MTSPPRAVRTPLAVGLWVLAAAVPWLDAVRGGRYVESALCILVLVVAGYLVGAWLPPLLAGLAAASGATLLAAASQLAAPGDYTFANDLFFFLVLVGGVALAGSVITGRAGQVRALQLLTTEREQQRADDVHAARLEEETRLALQVSERLAERVGGVLVQALGARVEPDPGARLCSLQQVELAARDALDRLRDAVGDLRAPDPVVAGQQTEHPDGPTQTRPSRPQRSDVLLGLTCLSVSAELVAGGQGVLTSLALGVGLGVAVALRRTATLLGPVLGLAALTAGELLGLPVQQQVTSLLPLSLLSYAVGAYPRTARNRSAGAVVLLCGLVLLSLAGGPGTEPEDGLLPTLLWAGFAVVVGMLAAQHEQRARHERRLQDQIEAGRGYALRLAVAQQRQATARDLHDTIAHSMTVVCLQAEGAQRSSGTGPDVVTAALEVIERTARSALEELRSGLADLEEAGRGSVATVVEAIHETAAELGVETSVRLVGPPDAACPQAALAARVVRESLVNVSRHAPGVAALVEIGGDPFTLTVTNPLGAVAPASPGTGLGLVGLAETVDAAGGRLEHEQRAGRFRIWAELPTSPQAVR